MNRIFHWIALTLILTTFGCKEDSSVANYVDEKAPISEVPELPQRPSEIEVLDLTEDVELFVVIAGAYSSVEGAQKKADALKKTGFTNADVVQRPGSNLYSALVERFDDEASAKAFAEEIATNDEIKSYVYKLDD